MSKPKYVQFGAGNIGRSFIGQLFARGGYDVVFVDVVDDVVNALNERHSYTIEVRDREPKKILVENVRAVNGKDIDAVVNELATCELCGTSVGAKALSYLWSTLAKAAQIRMETGKGPLDIILCENLRDAAAYMRQGLLENLPEGFDVDAAFGLVETSIGKMVPIMPEEVRKQDPLLVYAEAYNNLICDRNAFHNPVPEVSGLDARDNMTAYVDRKSFIHNFGHALLAYFSYLEAPELVTTWEAVGHPTIGQATRAGMWESAKALLVQYPDEFTEEALGDHIEDLLGRFANKALGDTIHRVGRDISRKLSREDRVIGPLLLQTKYGEPGSMTALCAAAGMRFLALDEAGKTFAPDQEFVEAILPKGFEYILDNICGLTVGDDIDLRAREAIKLAVDKLDVNLAAGKSIFA